MKTKSSKNKKLTTKLILESLSKPLMEDAKKFVASKAFPIFTQKSFETEEDKKKKEAVNHPSHYTQGKHEPIDVIADWKLGFNLGNAIKYIARHQHKGNALEDLKKARFYLDYEINQLENNLDDLKNNACI